MHIVRELRKSPGSYTVISGHLCAISGHFLGMWEPLQWPTLLLGFCLEPNASALYIKIKTSYNQASIEMWKHRIEFIAYLGKTEVIL